MNFLSVKKNIFVFTLLLIVTVSSTIPIISSNMNDTNSSSKIIESSSLTNVVVVEKRINKTIAFINEIIIIEILIFNLRNSFVYNVTVSEEEVLNPLINTSSLVSPLIFPKLGPNENVILAYTVSSSKPVNFTISFTVLTYQISKDDPVIFTSYSQSKEIKFFDKDLSLVNLEKEYFLLYSILISFYIIILFIRIAFKRKRGIQV